MPHMNQTEKGNTMHVHLSCTSMCIIVRYANDFRIGMIYYHGGSRASLHVNDVIRTIERDIYEKMKR